MKNEKGKLYLVPTPIGNLKDITFRAIETLNMVDLILAEDTRTSSVLLNHYSIKTPAQSYHKFNEKEMSAKIIKKLEEGQNIALISDAGTPLISDPGAVLIAELYSRGIVPVPLAGACAFVTFMSAISLPEPNFEFVGFLPHKQKEREQIFEKCKDHTVVFYESPNRIVNTLMDWQKLFPDGEVAIGRELTKIHEEIKQGKVVDVIDYYTKKPPKGEIVGAFLKVDTPKQDVERYIRPLLKEGYGAKDISKILAVVFGANKKEVYQQALESINKEG